jgi:hypothetical protein
MLSFGVKPVAVFFMEQLVTQACGDMSYFWCNIKQLTDARNPVGSLSYFFISTVLTVRQCRMPEREEERGT